ncbi:methylesterase 17-like [Tripterygium wilfordii]|uniref:methylesterase 17-like n=1 Tax=Tripterygium wilfordii TaxID=458696 RepID=UPI0018F832BF|nr:methylesterase 17-like [Tripterygium wilfordii]
MHFVLVHGAGHGAWCWYKIRCLMEASGYKVTCLDLKSAGVDLADRNYVSTFDEYNQPLTNFISNLPQNHKVCLVAHNASGANITDAMYRFPEKIHVAIYIAANMWKHGSPGVDVKLKQPQRDIYEFEYAFGPDQPPTSVKVNEKLRHKLLYSIESEGAGARKYLDGPGDGSVPPRVFIKTVHDQMAIPENQDAMIESWPPSNVYEVESDHSPFFSTPFALFSLLVKAAT